MSTERMWGADVDALDRLGRDLDVASDQLGSIENRLRVHVHASPWRGGDASGFASDWEGRHRATLAAAQEALRAAGESVRRHALEQRRASSGDGGILLAIPAAGTAGSVGVGLGAVFGGGRWPDAVSSWLTGKAGDLAHNAVGSYVDWMERGGLARFGPRWPAGSPGGVGGQFRPVSGMTVWQRFLAAGKEESWVTRPFQGAARGAWRGLANGARVVAAVQGFVEGSSRQWAEDADDASLSSEARQARAVSTGALTAAGSLAGASMGVQLGFAIGSFGGPLGAAAGVVVGGAIGGAAGSAAGQALGHLAADVAGELGEVVAHSMGDGVEAVGEGVEAASTWNSRHNPFG